jgi:Flp pilus assembly protein TadD
MTAWRHWRPLLLVAVLLVATLGVQRVAETAAGDAKSRVGALPSISFLETVALGYRAAVADLAWLQAVQYYGEHRQGGNDFSEFRHFVQAVNTLDPRFGHAYIFGAIVLATEGRDVPGAMQVLRRGARANPQSALFPFEMGFLTYVQGGDVRTAMRYLQLAAQKPGGRDRAQRFLAFMNRKLGRLETAWMLWDDLRRTTKDPSLRIVADESCRKIEAALRKGSR